MSQRVNESQISTNDEAGVPDHTQVVERINENVHISNVGDTFSYDTGNNDGQVAGNTSRDIQIPITKPEVSILLVKVVPQSDTQASFEIYEDSSRDKIDRAFRATRIEDTDILNTVPPGVTGLSYNEKSDNAELNARIINNTTTPSNFKIEVKVI
jgi:hypothetical protein